MRRAAITGWGKCVPPAVLTNDDLATLMDTSDEWIATRTGIKERRITHTETSAMAAVAGARAIACAGIEPDSIDFVIVATCTPDRLIPSVAATIQSELGLGNAGALDVNAACSGFVYALGMAHSMIIAGLADRVLAVGAEKYSSLLNLDDRGSAVLFGDGAGAVVLEGTSRDIGIEALSMHSDGSHADKLSTFGFGTLGTDGHEDEPYGIQLDGKEIFRQAVTRMAECASAAIGEAGWELDDVDVFIAHQANTRIIDAIARRLDLPQEKVFVNIAGYGNTSAASIPIALSDALDEGRIRPGGKVVFVAFGGGLTWGAVCLTWGDRIDPISVSDAKLPPTDATGLELLMQRQEDRKRRGFA